MIEKYKILTSFLGIALAATILFLARRNVLYSRYCLWWLFIAAAVLLFGVFPGLSDVIGGYLGVKYPPVLILIGAVVLLFIKSLSMDIERSRQEVRIRRLVQRLSMLQAQLETMEAKASKDD